VNVRCFNATGTAVDTRYALSYMSDVGLGSHASGGQHVGGYVWASQPTVASYTPAEIFQFNNAGRGNRVSRSSPGTYRVYLPMLAPSGRTTAVTTASGSGSEHCTVDGWGSDGSTGTIVNVACFNGTGRIDTRFTLLYLTDDQLLF
jgi:hypothetical protein